MVTYLDGFVRLSLIRKFLLSLSRPTLSIGLSFHSERERSSMRWQQFATLVAGNAPMPERGFASALYYQVSGEADYGRKAIEFALSPAS